LEERYGKRKKKNHQLKKSGKRLSKSRKSGKTLIF
jgi:hypothetical protein